MHVSLVVISLFYYVIWGIRTNMSEWHSSNNNKKYMLLVKIFSCNNLMSASKICCIQVLKFKKISLYRLLISCICNNLSYHKHARNMHVLISNYNHPIECNKLFLIACVMQILLNFEASACIANFFHVD